MFTLAISCLAFLLGLITGGMLTHKELVRLRSQLSQPYLEKLRPYNSMARNKYKEPGESK